MIYRILPFFFAILPHQLALGQSPFNYEPNKNVYFMSTELRNQLGIDKIYTTNQEPWDWNNTIWEIWQIQEILFDSSDIIESIHTMELDETFQFNLDSLMKDSRYLNTSNEYIISDKKLIEWRGTDSFMDVIHFSDTVSIVIENQNRYIATTYSKNVFNKQGHLLYHVSYPTPKPPLEEESDTEEDIFYLDILDTLTQEDYEAFFTTLIKNADAPTDTSYYHYDTNGNLLTIIQENNTHTLYQLSTNHTTTPSQFIVHQCYLGKTKMEEFFLENIGFTPELVLIEIYKYGVLSFNLNRNDQKYYQTNTIILERRERSGY